MSHHIMIGLSVGYAEDKTDGPTIAEIREALRPALEALYPDDTIAFSATLATTPVMPMQPVPMPDPDSGILIGDPPEGVGWAE